MHKAKVAEHAWKRANRWWANQNWGADGGSDGEGGHHQVGRASRRVLVMQLGLTQVRVAATVTQPLVRVVLQLLRSSSWRHVELIFMV